MTEKGLLRLETYHFCTYFDHRYLARGLALCESLMKHCPGARLWVLCLSDECFTALSELALRNIVPISLGAFEAGNHALAAAKADRSTIEYYFTCTAALMDWLLKQNPGIEIITYLDGDLFFFADPRPIFVSFSEYSTLIIEHRFPPALKSREVYGKYNVGWVSFRRDPDGIACLEWWRDRCLEWCHDRLEEDRFADQKYLDRMPEMFSRVLVLDNPGANLAPWNLACHHVEENRDHLTVDGQPLIFFHFHGFRQIAPLVWRTHHSIHGVSPNRTLTRFLYRPYIRALRRGARAAIAGSRASGELRGRQTPLFRRLKNLALIAFHRDFVLG